MAWASRESEAMAIVKTHMINMDYERKQKLADYYLQSFFPNQGDTWSNVAWKLQDGVVYISMWDDEHLLKNIKLAMIREMIGLGPYKYCIINNVMPRFESNLMLLIYFLPAQKMCFYPTRHLLFEPFQHSPWNEIGQEILLRTHRTNHPIPHIVYRIQQYVVYLTTGFWGPSFIL